MAMQGEGKDTKGRSYEQLTRDGTSSAGTMGSGGTGDIGGAPDASGQAQGAQGGNRQAGRTDDLLAGGSDAECEDKGFMTEGKQGQLGTGRGGKGSLGSGSAGNRQSGELSQQGAGGQGPSETGRDQDSSARKP